MPGVPYTLDSLISKQSEISADFQKMNRVFTIYGMPYFTLFQNVLSLFSGFEFLKVSKSTLWIKSTQAWVFLGKRIKTNFCLLESQEYTNVLTSSYACLCEYFSSLHLLSLYSLLAVWRLASKT